MDLATFKASFPEFNSKKNAEIQVALDQARREVSPEIFGSSFDRAHGLRAAHIMSISPFGHTSRLTDAGGETSIYEPEFRRIRRLVAPRYMVL